MWWCRAGSAGTLFTPPRSHLQQEGRLLLGQRPPAPELALQLIGAAGAHGLEALLQQLPAGGHAA